MNLIMKWKIWNLFKIQIVLQINLQLGLIATSFDDKRDVRNDFLRDEETNLAYIIHI